MKSGAGPRLSSAAETTGRTPDHPPEAVGRFIQLPNK
jgi:hypothetical protein